MLLLLAATAAGCGSERPPAPRTPVRLTLSAPRDLASTRDASVLVSGRVAPTTSRVLVLGRRVAVENGRFSTTVGLREGANVIDVGAAAPGARAVWRALRVTRRTRITLPELVGREEAAAQARLQELGLRARVIVDDDLLDVFRRGPRLVCHSDPESGSMLRPGSDVDLVVSKTC